MPRFPDCNKFVSLDTETEPEVNSEDIDDDGAINIELRLVNNCAECSTELAETTQELTAQVPGEVMELHTGDGHSLELEVEDLGRDERYATTDRRGKPIKKSRYQKKFYVGLCKAVVTCSCSTEPIYEEDLSEETQAGDFDSLV